jgi:hypothetical protein
MKKLSLILLFLLAFASTAAGSNRIYYENFNDQNIGAPPFGSFTLQCDDGVNHTCSSNEYFFPTGRGGTGYAWSGNQNVAAMITWYMARNWKTQTGSDEIYTSFWMKFANYTKTADYENFKTMRPWLGDQGAMEFVASAAGSHVFAVYADDGTILTSTQHVATPGSFDGNWHHYEIWFKFSTGHWKIWYDGVLRMDKAYGPGKWSGQIYYWTLGSIDATAQGVFMRQFDDFEVWDGMPEAGGTTDSTPPYVDNFSPADGATGVPVGTTSASFRYGDSGTGAAGANIAALNVGGKTCSSCGSCSAGLTCSGTSSAYTITRTGLSLSYGQAWSEVITGADLAGNAMTPRTYNFTVQPDPTPPVEITACTLPPGTVGTAYSGGTVTTTGGYTPYSYDRSAGTVPPGLSIADTTGLPVGTPSQAGAYNWTLRVTDSSSNTATRACSLMVAPLLPGGQTVDPEPGEIRDTYIDRDFPTTNFSSDAYVRMMQQPLGTPSQRMIFQVADLDIPSNVLITSATLRLRHSYGIGSGGTNPTNLYVYPVTGQGWTIEDVTWNSFDNTNIGAAEDAVAVALGGAYWSFNVTQSVRAAYLSGAPWTVMVDGGGDGESNTNRNFVSMDGTAALVPVLSVTYTQLTEPGGVSIPAPGKIRVSSGKFTFR